MRRHFIFHLPFFPEIMQKKRRRRRRRSCFAYNFPHLRLVRSDTKFPVRIFLVPNASQYASRIQAKGRDTGEYQSNNRIFFNTLGSGSGWVDRWYRKTPCRPNYHFSSGRRSFVIRTDLRGRTHSEIDEGETFWNNILPCAVFLVPCLSRAFTNYSSWTNYYFVKLAVVSSIWG